MDRVVTGVAADIEKSAARDICQRNGGFDYTELAQRVLDKAVAAFEILCRNPVIKIDLDAPRFSTA